MLVPNQIVRVRSRQYLIESIEAPPKPGDSTLVRLSCLEDDARGEKLEVLWEKEVDANPLQNTNWTSIASRGFDVPRLFSAYLHTLRWNCVTSTNAKLFQAPYRAGIEVKAYQLEPLRLALNMPRVNLFIADDVGLGKTIEAGLILRELLIRQKVRRCVICAPPSVVRQWQDEMEERFGLSFVIYDRDYVSKVRQERGYAVNPWRTHTRFIISQALIREEPYASPLRDWLTEFSSGALLILDEAHNVAPASGSKYAIDSKLTRAMRDLAHRFEHKLFLSATPHNGHSNSFSALLELLDPQRFCRGVPVDAKLRDEVMVRRLKSDLRAIGEPFPKRNILKIEIDKLPANSPELELSRLLQQYRQARAERLANASKTQQLSAMLVVTSLQKRLLSSIDAFTRTLEVHRKSMSAATRKKVAPDPHTLDLLQGSAGSDDERSEYAEVDIEREEDAQMEAATQLSTSDTAPLAPELALLEKMSEIGRRYRYDADARMKQLLKWIKENLCPTLGTKGAPWLPRRVIIFTEYTDTKRYIEQQLQSALQHSERASERVATFHGGIRENNRELIKAAFNANPNLHPLRILVATDAAREGINLQNNCYDLFHFDVPWNPGRLEQRNGRIDRKLQQAKEVNCYYFVLPQRAEDRVLDVLMQKTRKIHEELGSVSPVIERKLDLTFQNGIAHDKIKELTSNIEGIDGEIENDETEETARVRTMKIEMGHEESPMRHFKLQTNLSELRNLLDSSKRWIGLDDRHFQDALSASLETLGAGGLELINAAEAALAPEKARWRIPLLHERKGADPSWAATLDSLRTPKKKDQKPSEWRREAQIRPVVFNDPGNLDGEVVHLHLEHRVVQRLLGRFLSQGFRDDDLCRACVLETEEAIPQVVLLGRLSLFGEGGARLHDEILAAAAVWKSPEERGTAGSLLALSEADKANVLQMVEHAFAQPSLKAASTSRQDYLKQHAARDVAELTAHLEQRAQELTNSATEALKKRSEGEAQGMSDILTSQRKRIRDRQKEFAEPKQQMMFSFSDEEKRQLQADQKYWSERLIAIGRELREEPERIKKSYIVKASRVEPVGLVYLWPHSS